MSVDRTDGPPENPVAESARTRDHLANERTLLAWVRTALTIVGLGFVVGRLLVDDGRAEPLLTAASVVLVLVGGAASLFAAQRFMAVQRQIDTGAFQPTWRLDVALAALVAIAAAMVAVYLLIG